ncbi:MAG: hypothetical protein K8S14_06925 [Actinomycetia bacterium]|nr:hypothetical protein [Actinomycetes bacterium]
MNQKTKERKGELKEFAKRARCDGYMAAGVFYTVFKSRNISMDEFFGGEVKNAKI